MPLFRTRLADRVRDIFAGRYYLLVRYVAQHRRDWMDDVTRVKAENELLLNHCEACQLISAVVATNKVPGEIAELGVAYGASAKLIAKYAGGRPIHLFDTFDGLPAPLDVDSAKVAAGDFKTTLGRVQAYLADTPKGQISYHQGYFPQTAGPVADRAFSFVHLDADLYESTIEALKFFYPRMSPGGIILGHDYLSAAGVDRAYAEVFADKPEPVVELSGYQCLMVKI